MRICHVAHGHMPIPPAGWGAVEALIWDYKLWIERFGHDFCIVNTSDIDAALHQIHAFCPDVVHVHCERYFKLLPALNAKVKVACSHWPLLYEADQRQRLLDFMTGNFYICCLTEKIRQYLTDNGIAAERLFVSKNGARADLHQFMETPLYPGRSIYLAAINRRKRQYLVQDFDFIDFVGPRQDDSFDVSAANYLGEWSREMLYARQTHYSNLVLLSRSEVAPLVTCGALMSGLGLVVSESAAVNLPLDRPFIDVIPEDRITDRQFIQKVIRTNQCKSVALRKEIRHYAETHLDWKQLVAGYLKQLEIFLREKSH